MKAKILSLACLSLVSQAVIAATSSEHISLNNQTLDIIGQASPNRIVDQYIVIFNDNVSSADMAQVRNSINNANANSSKTMSNDAPLLRSFSVVKGFAGKISPRQLSQLQGDSRIKSIEVDKTVNLDFASRTVSAGVWGLDRIDQKNLPLDNSYSPYQQGAGVHAYVIDTGIRTTHNDLGGRAVWDFTASTVNDGNLDGNGHGTHIAGTIGGSTYGVANAVSLHSVKVFDSSGTGTVSGIIEGVNYVTNNHQSPAVATIGVSTSYSQALNDAVDASIAAGVVYAVPVGDVYKDACNYSPGSVSGALSVASSDKNDNVPPYTNKGSCVDLYAPGIYIKALWITNDNANNTISHSPMAAAHVAGAAAIIRGEDASCTPAQVKQRLLSYTHNGVLNNVPAISTNRLLGVPTSAVTQPTCSDVVGDTFEIINDGGTFAGLTGAEPINGLGASIPRDSVITEDYSAGIRCVAQGGFQIQSSNDRLRVESGPLTFTFDTGVTGFGFNAYLQGATAIVTLVLENGDTRTVTLTQDGFVGINSSSPILVATFEGVDGLELDGFVSNGVALPDPTPTTITNATASTFWNVDPPLDAIDGLLGSNVYAWISNNLDPAPWLKLHLPTSQNVVEYHFSRGYCTFDAYFAGSWTMSASNDDVSWTLIDTVATDQSAFFPLATGCTEFGPTYTIDNPGSYKYYRLDFTASPLSSTTGVSVGEIQLLVQ